MTPPLVVLIVVDEPSEAARLLRDREERGTKRDLLHDSQVRESSLILIVPDVGSLPPFSLHIFPAHTLSLVAS